MTLSNKPCSNFENCNNYLPIGSTSRRKYCVACFKKRCSDGGSNGSRTLLILKAEVHILTNKLKLMEKRFANLEGMLNTKQSTN